MSEQEPEMPSGEDAEQAALKIQALQRGKKTREEINQKKEAATKIQALQRGNSVRKQQGPQNGGDEQAEGSGEQAEGGGEEMPSGEDAEAAAVKIQALQRGKKTREEMKQKKQTADSAPNQPQAEETEGEAQGGEGGEEEMPSGEDVEQAAVKIQALTRGRQTRKGKGATASGGGGGQEATEEGTGGGGAEEGAVEGAEEGAGGEEMPSGEDVEAAAVKIQALQRGRQARQGKGAGPGPGGGSEREEAGAPKLERQWTAKEKAAATKIQAAQRGRQARHILSNNDLDAARDIFAGRQAMRDRHMEASTLARQHNQAQGDVVTLMANKKVLDEAHQYSKRRKDEDELAAVQMQSLYRGFRDRKAVRRVREEAESKGREKEAQQQLHSAQRAARAAAVQRGFHGYSAAGTVNYMGHGPTRVGGGGGEVRKAVVSSGSGKKEQAPTLVDKKAVMSAEQKLACAVVESITHKWATSYARAVELQPGAEATGELKFVGLFSKPSKEEPIAWPVVRVHFSVPTDFHTALLPRVTYCLEGERMVYDVTTDLGRRFKESWLDRIVMDKRAIRADMALRSKR